MRVLHAYGMTTLADLTVRIARRGHWWKAVPGLGMASARAIEALFAVWPALTNRVRALVIASHRGDIESGATKAAKSSGKPGRPSACAV
ncbi:phage integrase family protein [Paraburkholderia rhynchosiae]|uniref:phage integrase family protein n=1 Tax=Paraburkholderia rhynchosiae TaxID=487049 RepID=UPI00387E34EE